MSVPLPEISPAAPERVLLTEFLTFYRTVFLRKTEEVDDEDARHAACPPSGLTIMGIVRHLSEVERSWFRRGVAGEDAGPIYFSDEDPDGDFHLDADDTLHAAIDTWRGEVACADAILADAGLDDLDRSRGEYSVRWILIHMIEEYARHCGHLDLIREAIDGRTGD